MKRLSLFATLVAASITAAITVGATSASAATVDGVPVTCQPTGFIRDGINMTAAVIGGANTDVNASTAGGTPACNIGVYVPPGSSAAIYQSQIHGANYFGVVANASHASVAGNHVYDIGESPFNGSQHGVGVFFTTLEQDGVTSTGAAASGNIMLNTIDSYQKNGVVVNGPGAVISTTDNTVTGEGQITYIAQNGIQYSRGAAGTVKTNTISDNWYADSPDAVQACGLLYFNSDAVKASGNKFRGDEQNVCNFGARGGGNFTP